MAVPFVIASDLPRDARVYVYGSGAGGQALARYLIRSGLDIAGYIDSFREGCVDGLPMHRFDQYLAMRRPEDALLIGSTFVSEIERHLAAHGITDALDGSLLATALVEQSRMASRVVDGRIRLTVPEAG